MTDVDLDVLPVPNVGDAPGETGVAGWAPSELQQAYQNGDYNTIQTYTTNTAQDLSPIYANIQNHGDAALFGMENGDGTTFPMAISGDPDNPDGYLWVFSYPPTPPSGSSSGSDGSGSSTPKLAQVAQIGTYSTSGRTISISNRIWDSAGVELTASAISAIVGTVVFKYLKNFMTSQDSSSAMAEAATDAGTELVEDGIISAVDWGALAAGMGAFAMGIVAGAVVFFLMMFITNFIDITFTVAVNIYNWDPNHSYIVNEPYYDNAVISGGQQFSTQTIEQPTSQSPQLCIVLISSWLLLTSCYWNEDEIKLPNGFEPSDETVYSYLTVTFTNSEYPTTGGVATFTVELTNCC